MPRGFTMKTPENVALARRLRDEGLFLREIAERIGVRGSTVGDWLSDPDKSKQRARREAYRGVCEECGKQTDGSFGPGKAPRLCLTCFNDARTVWTREAIVLRIQEWADDTGGIPPSANDWMCAKAAGDDTVPTVSHVIYRWGTWNAAIRAAGLEPHSGGGGRYELTPEQRRIAADRYAAGESSVQVAASLGCAPLTVVKWARHHGVPIRPCLRRAAA